MDNRKGSVNSTQAPQGRPNNRHTATDQSNHNDDSSSKIPLDKQHDKHAEATPSEHTACSSLSLPEGAATHGDTHPFSKQTHVGARPKATQAPQGRPNNRHTATDQSNHNDASSSKIPLDKQHDKHDEATPSEHTACSSLSLPEGAATHGDTHPSSKQTHVGARPKVTQAPQGRPNNRHTATDQSNHNDASSSKIPLDKQHDKQTPPGPRTYNGARTKTPICVVKDSKHAPLPQLKQTDTPKKTDITGSADKRYSQTKSRTTPSEYAAPAGIKIIIMNVNGHTNGAGTAERRKHAIQNVITNEHPSLMIIQEYKTLEDIHQWKAHAIPEYYTYKGNDEASLLVDTRDTSVFDMRDTELQRILEKLQKTANNNLHVAFPLDFNPLPRMFMMTVKTKGVPYLEFICVSWHGPWNKGFSKEPVRQEHFKYFMEFLRVVYGKYTLPLLIGGDFNINIGAIVSLVKLPFILSKYTASERRSNVGVKDYFIHTSELKLTGTRYISLPKETDALDVLDHDPIISYLSK